MSNDESIEAIAADRLTMPGVVDREPVLDRYDRLQHPIPASALADRLHQRAAHSDASEGQALVWKRSRIAPGAVVTETPMTPRAMGIATAAEASSVPVSAPAHSPSVQRSAVSTQISPTPAVVQRLIQRQHAPGVVAAAESTAQSTAQPSTVATSTIASKLHARHGSDKRQPVSIARSMTSSGSAGPSVVMRHVDPAKEEHSSAELALSDGVVPISIARKPLSVVGATVNRKADLKSGLPHVTPVTPMAPVAHIARTADVTSPISTARPAHTVGRASLPSASSTPLVLQRVAAPLPASPSTPPIPYAMPSSTAVAEELTRAAQSEKPSGTPHVAAAAHTGSSDIDRMAEEVQRRLRHRLEIERERRGIRSWR